MNKNLELEELYKYIYNSELLVIDDLGTETTNAFVCSKLFEVINQRGLTGKFDGHLDQSFHEGITGAVFRTYHVPHH